jgi:hypothetical protein
MQDSSEISCLMAWETFSIPTKISISDNLLREKNMEKETIFLAKEPFSVGYGTMILKFKGS